MSSHANIVYQKSLVKNTVLGQEAKKQATRVYSSRLPSRCRSQARFSSATGRTSVTLRTGSSRVISLRASSESATTSPTIQYEDLVEYIAQGCKPRDKWRIGTEHEKFGFRLDDLTPMGYEEVKLLESLRDRFNWEPIMEGENIIGVKQNGQSVTLEPGGQFELSGAPTESIHETCAEVNSHLYQVKSIAEEIGVGFLGMGFQPKWSVEETPVMPKGRYKIMKAYMPTVGSMGLDMMFRTCTVQVNLDYESEEDMVEKMRISLALQPIATALFANSPFKDGKPSGYKSLRAHVWTDTDNARTGDLPFVFDEGFGFSSYVDWVLDVPMYFVYREGRYINVLGQSFRSFMKGELEGELNGEYPTLDDWEAHLTTVFPEVRLKRFIEMRGADSGPFKRICALPALWVGLLYNEDAQKEAYEYIKDWTQTEREYLRSEVARTGMQTPFRDGTVLDIARDVLKIAKKGLQNRGYNETRFLQELEKIVATGRTPADALLEAYEERWGQSVNGAFKDVMY